MKPFKKFLGPEGQSGLVPSIHSVEKIRRREFLLGGACTALLLVSSCSSEGSVDNTEVSEVFVEFDGTLETFFTKCKNLATQVEDTYAIPAGIVLAQAHLESAGGTSELAQQANALFGIKAHADWSGDVYIKPTSEEILPDSLQQWQSQAETYGGEVTILEERGDGKLLIEVPQPFRKYGSIDESFLDHGDRIRNSGLYTPPQDAVSNPEGYIRAIAPVYATDSEYAEKVLDVYRRVQELA